MLKIFAVLAVLTGPVSCVTVTVPESSVNTIVGGNITLLCTYTTVTPSPLLSIKWSFYSAKEKKGDILPPCQYMDEKSISHCRKTVYMTDARGRCSWRYKIYYYQEGQSYSYGEFKGRIQSANKTGNASITIFNMQASDTGVYKCEVFNPADTNAQNEKSITVSVLVAPSQLHCGYSKTPEVGHLLTLFCTAKAGLPAPTYQWDKVLGDTVERVTETYDAQTGIFVIGNLTHFEEGYYRCTSTNFLGNSTCQTDVTIKHSESGVIIGALIGAILAAALICGIVWFLTSKEKKKKRQEKAAISEMQTVSQKEPLSSEYSAVPSRETAPVASALPSKESNETNEYVIPEETEVAAVPGSEIQDVEKHPVA